MNETIKLIYPFNVTWNDYPDNESQAVLLYCLTCEHKCANCQNSQLQGGFHKDAQTFSIQRLYEELKSFCEDNKTNKIVLSGGDWAHPVNRDFTRIFLRLYYKEFDFCLYTGYEIADVRWNAIRYFTFLKTGKYDESLKQEVIKNDDYFQLASSNQKIYDKNCKCLTVNGRMEFR